VTNSSKLQDQVHSM